MFKNQSSFSLPNKKTSAETARPIKEAPIHTMAQDLQDPNGSLAQPKVLQENSANKFSQENLSEKQKSSPFLNSIDSQQRPTVQPSVVPTPPSQEKVAPSLHLTKETPKSALIPVLLVIFIILIAGAGTYYFISTRQNDLYETPGQSSTPTGETSMIPEEVILKEVFSTKNPNYLSLDTTIITPASFKNILLEKSAAIIDSEIMAPVEFIVTDEQNNPILFSEFAKMAGFSLSTSIMAGLDENFSLFVINDGDTPGIGLVISTKETIALKKTLSKEEATLSSQIDPILLTKYEPSVSPFEDYAYANYAVRYQNLISPQELAVDYSIVGTQLVFATTKLTIESLIDSLVLANSEVGSLN